MRILTLGGELSLDPESFGLFGIGAGLTSIDSTSEKMETEKIEWGKKQSASTCTLEFGFNCCFHRLVKLKGTPWARLYTALDENL